MMPNDLQPAESDQQPGDKPLKLKFLVRPDLRPGETREEAARRLSRELFGKLKPAADQAGDSGNDAARGS